MYFHLQSWVSSSNSMGMEQQHPVVEYSIRELGDKGMAGLLELDKVVLARWDMFMQKGSFR